MSLGAVAAFQPTQPTQEIAVGIASAGISFGQCDTLLLYNSGTQDVFVIEGAALNGLAAVIPTPSVPSMGVWVKAGASVLLGANINTRALAAICASSTSNLFVTPGTGAAFA